MSTLKRIALVLLVMLIWTAFVGLGFVQGYLLKPITSQKTPEAFIQATKEKLDDESVGNFAITLIENGTVAEEFFYTIGEPVNRNTMFPVASISKWVTSFGILKLVEEGKIDLDKPVDEYLTRWHLPPSEFNNKEVTVRRLLSHSAGLVDDLGYAGFKPGERVQTIEESLTKAADSPYAEGVARVGYEPGSKFMYSGAGYTILQLLIEEVTGQSFQEYMTQNVFEPLDMQHSTFVLAEKPNSRLAQIYKTDGSARSFNTFTALAAASLMASTADLSKFVQASISPNKVLSEETVANMSIAQIDRNGVDYYGLGPHLYSQNDKNSLIIGHDGSGNDAINTAARVDLMSKDGIIILETGSYNLASALADEWMFWKAGVADFVVMQRNMPYLLTLLVIGYVLIIVAAVAYIRYKQKASS